MSDKTLKKHKSNEIKNFYSINNVINNILKNQNDLLIYIESRISNLSAYDQEQYDIYLTLGYLVSYLNENKDEILYYYRDFYDENNPDEKDEYSRIFTSYNDLIDEITANQINLKKTMMNNKLKSAFLLETEVKVLKFIQSFKWYKSVFPERIGNYFTEEENNFINKKEIRDYQSQTIKLLKDEGYESFKNLKDFNDFKLLIRFEIEKLELKSWLLDEDEYKESYVSIFEPNKKEYKKIEKMLKVYGKYFLIKN